jgi:hypothetical protein
MWTAIRCAPAVALGTGAACTDAGVLREIGLSVAAPAGVVVALSCAPAASLFRDRLRLGIGPRLAACFDSRAALSVRLVGGFELGTNVDVIGGGLGPSVTGSYAGADPRFAGAQRASPTTFNLLLLGKHDRGQLDSEFFAAYWFGQWGLRVGVSHMSTEYTTSRSLDAGNDRLRASATRFFVAAGYRFE